MGAVSNPLPDGDSAQQQAADAAAQQPVFPSPEFEGSEKRIEVDFYASVNGTDRGFRAVSRADIDALLKIAECEIVSHMANTDFDAYVLSESSLFVYPTKVVIKTCGTTALLKAVPRLLELADGIGMKARRCKFSRLSYMWAHLQPAPHRTFADEVAFLDGHFGHFGHGSSSYVMGNNTRGPNWHVYVADADGVAPSTACPKTPTYTMEVCMTELDKDLAKAYFRTEAFVSAAETTRTTGIGALLPRAEIDDYVFEPCGYSMNSQEEDAFATIHITPEDGFSYASMELSGYRHNDYDPSTMVRQIGQVFRPGVLSVTMSVDALLEQGNGSWDLPLAAPKGYAYEGGTSQVLSCGGRVTFHTYRLLPEPVGAAEAPASADIRMASKFSPSGSLSVLEDVSLCRSESSDSDEEALGHIDDIAGGRRSRGSAGGGSSPPPAKRARVSKVPLIHDAQVVKVMRRFGVEAMACSDPESVDDFCRRAVAEHALEETFYVVDLGVIMRLHEVWRRLMPRVEPFYAVKCNPDDAIISTLAALGTSFDCASVAEIERVMRLGVEPRRIVFANPCKLPSHIRHARAVGCNLTTFDTACELDKIKADHPGTGLLIRLRADDPDARCQLGNKFGAEPEDAPALLARAKELGLFVVGVSFHVGSGATNPACFSRAIRLARDAFDEGLRLGFEMATLDIGGGFSGGMDGHGEHVIARVAKAVNGSLLEHFPEEGGVRVIAEPGRYFVEASSTLASNVFGKRDRAGNDTDVKEFDYWISDGLYGSMNCLLYDHATISCRPVRIASGAPPKFAAGGGEHEVESSEEQFSSTVFGPTCDGLDTVLRGISLPELEAGDWLTFPAMGAYTSAAGSNFNGFNCTNPRKYYVCSAADQA